MQKLCSLQASEDDLLIRQLLQFSKKFRYLTLFHSNQYPDPYGKYEVLAGFGAYRLFAAEHNVFKELKDFYENSPSWLFGHFGYDLKNQLEDLSSRKIPKFNFPDIFFYEPAYLVFKKRGAESIEFWCNQDVDPEPLWQLKKQLREKRKVEMKPQELPPMEASMSKAEYLHAIRQLKKEIQEGNIYEVNYCQEYFAKQVKLDAESMFEKLNRHSPMPFAAFYRYEEEAVICASPERFLAKRGNGLIAQPIKGTARRGSKPKEDEEIKKQLRNDLKEQTENVMIVDLLRNDLSRTAAKSSVKVEELFGVYTFPQVHQLISTIRSELAEKYHFTDAIKYAFPMGSMTGAPKISAMQLIDTYEQNRRGLYSASIGYIDPNGDFDFNVVIRSLVYSEKSGYLSLSVGGAITDLSEAEKEYRECLLKAKAIFEL